MILFQINKILKDPKYKNKSYRNLASEIGIDHVSFWKMLNNKPYNPSLKMIEKLCNYFDCQPGDIIKYKK